MAERLYRRLPGRGSGLLTTATLWEADDHLLLVESTRINETYKRFFYRDIQAIVICRTKTGLVTSSIAALVTLIFGAFTAGTSVMELQINMGILTGLSALVALVSFVKGSTCRCILRTAVQTQTLRSLGRLRKARKVCRRLQPKIEAAQAQPSTP